MTTQLAASQSALEAALAAVASADPAIRDKLRAEISLIGSLRQQVGTASVSALSTMRAEVATIAESASAAAQDARTSAAGDLSSGSAIAIVAQAAHNETNRVMAGMKDFDRDLKFGPNDTEADYRKREAERQSYIATEQAKHTPAGELNASGAAVGQMADAAAHGAAANPAFAKRWEELVVSTEHLREAAKANGVSTEEFDHRLSEDLRRIMKSKGLTDAQIDARFAANNGDPLATAKSCVQNDTDIANLKRSTERVADLAKSTSGAAQDDVKNLIASLQTAGVVTTPHDPAAAPDHGVGAASSINVARSV